jgi:hypothetical protein
MNTSRRPLLLFYYGSSDEWIESSALQIVEACDKIGWRCVVVGQPCTARLPKHLVISPALFRYLGMFNIFGRVDWFSLVAGAHDVRRHTGLRRETDDGCNAVKKHIRHAREASIIIKLLRPDKVIVWNGLVDRRRAMVDVCRALGIEVVFAEKGFLAGSWYMDPEGVNARSSFVRSECYREPPTDHMIRVLKARISEGRVSGMSGWEQPKRQLSERLRAKLGLDSAKTIVFFAGQLDEDTNITLFSPYFVSVVDALKWLVNGLDASRYQLVFKPHPKDSTSLNTYRTILGVAGVVVADLNIFDALDISDVVVAINSSVILEAVVSGKPVVQLGHGILDKAPYVVHYNGLLSVDELLLKAKQLDPEQIQLLACKHLARYVNIHYYYHGEPVNIVTNISFPSVLPRRIQPYRFFCLISWFLDAIGMLKMLERAEKFLRFVRSSRLTKKHT